MLLSLQVAAQSIRTVTPSEEKVGLYGKVEVTVTLEGGNWNNPYLQEEAAMDLEILCPSGRRILLPCFFSWGQSAKGSIWKARLTPQEVGEYSFRAIYSERGKAVTTSRERSLECIPSDNKGILHPNDNWTLRFDDGTLFRGIGENICWESRQSDDSKFFSDLHEQHERFSYDRMIPYFAANGGNFVRMWMCPWNFPIDRGEGFNNTRYVPTDFFINESAAHRLDYTLDLAQNNGVYVMLCLGSGNQRTNEAFFRDDTPKTLYRNYLRYIVARWGYSPAVGMWEFFNEIDNIQFRNRPDPIAASLITGWHAEMSHYLKGLDPFGHIVTTSISHRDVDGLNSVPDIDINQKHIYRATSSIPENLQRYTREFSKPYIIGEFGFEWDWNRNFNDFAPDMDADFKRGLWYGIFNPTPVTPMSWWWEFFDERGLVPYFKCVRMVSDMMLEVGKGSFQPLKVEVKDADAYAVKCGDTVFLYVFNTGKETLTSVKVESTLSSGKLTTQQYDFHNLSFGKECKLSSKTGIAEVPLSLASGQEKLLIIRKRHEK